GRGTFYIGNGRIKNGHILKQTRLYRFAFFSSFLIYNMREFEILKKCKKKREQEKKANKHSHLCM
uniref:Uncharacterized protein n=1 Tax=Ciona intestinalis TaxID=7719 RepID=H2Y3H3_CIOIN